ncbi:hypothetical protein [Corynebacterium timonense]|uniref:DUF2339 domain-containing protein n=1 Tax=Corynebacterium timonense TaxID=441500 RepID=A0A1H1PK19_9CORY|nr:hypothetical protein [Corynebacterium timonense]SDS11536.1 hypothetical protein SAMN04488539_1038 [Corynebacterium timonense]
MPNATPPELNAEVRRQLAVLEQEHAKTERLIARLRHQLASELAEPPQSAAPNPAAAPAPTPAPQLRRLSAEQRAVRTVAVLGTAITLTGVILAVVWAYQNDYLGTVGISVLGAVVSVGLAAGGVVTQQRRGPSVGVSALYGTSFLTAIAVLFYSSSTISSLTSPTPTAVAHLVIWLAFLALAVLQRSSVLVNVMLVAFVFYHFPFHVADMAASLLAFAAPLSVLSVDAWRRPFAKATPAFGSAAATAAVVFSLWTSTNNGDETALYGALGIAITVVVVALIALRPAWSINPASQLLALVLFPLIGFASAQFTVHSAALVWFPVIGAAAAAALTLRRPPAGHWWIGLVPIGFAAAIYLHNALDGAISLSVSTPLMLAYVAVFFGLGLLARTIRPAVRPSPGALSAMCISWVLVFLVIMGIPASPLPPALTTTALNDAGITAVFLAACAYHRGLFRRLDSVARVVCGAAVALLTLNVIVWPIMALVAAVPGADHRLGFWVGQAAASIAWILAASALLLVPRARTLGAGTAGLAAAVAIAAAFKLVLFDLRASSEPTRVVVFLLCGAILLAVAVARSRGSHDEPGTHADRDGDDGAETSAAASPESPAGTGR